MPPLTGSITNAYFIFRVRTFRMSWTAHSVYSVSLSQTTGSVTLKKTLLCMYSKTSLDFFKPDSYLLLRMDYLVAKIWSFIGVFTLLQNNLPPQLRQIFMQWMINLQEYFYSPHYNYNLDIPEFKDNSGLNANNLYDNVELYLNTLHGISRAGRYSAFRARNSSYLGFSPADGEIIEDCFREVNVWWTQNAQSGERDANAMNQRRCFTLIVAVDQADRGFLSAYFSHITDCAEEFNTLNKELVLHTNNTGRRQNRWTGIPFKHPSTFASLALDPLLKADILQDLDRFKRGKEFYRRVGRSWKRGYLLHGPPGTGKSSLIAAIANYMKYDVYDLELTQVYNNAQLRALLTQTTEKSVIIIEDIDCSLNLTDRIANPKPREDVNGSKVTLSGLLNFTDGLWSCCGEERIILFTTNHKEMLDPALLRSGRMDMHILLSFCTFPQFKSLAFNYLQIEDHPLFAAVEEKMESGAEITCAEIIEVLLSKTEHPREALNDVICALDDKLKEKEPLLPSTSAQADMEDVEEEEESFGTAKNSRNRCSGKRRKKYRRHGRRTESYIFN